MAKHEKVSPEETSRVVDLMGGTTAVANLCLVPPQTVSNWRQNGIPNGFYLYLRLYHWVKNEGGCKARL